VSFIDSPEFSSGEFSLQKFSQGKQDHWPSRSKIESTFQSIPSNNFRL